MSHTTADTPKIAIEEYSRMETGGWIALVLGCIGQAVLLTFGISTRVVLPTGLASLTALVGTSGCILLVGRLVLRKLDQVRVELEDHKADHERSAIDLDDVLLMKKHVADILTFMAKADLERKQGEMLVRQVEEFMAWRERVVRRRTELEQVNQQQAERDPSVERDAAWLADMAEALEMGREIERRRPPEQA